MRYNVFGNRLPGACPWAMSAGRPASRVAWGRTSPFADADSPAKPPRSHPDTNGTATPDQNRECNERSKGPSATA